MVKPLRDLISYTNPPQDKGKPKPYLVSQIVGPDSPSNFRGGSQAEKAILRLPVKASRFSRVILLAVWALCIALACLASLASQVHTARAAGSVTYEQRNYAVRIGRDGALTFDERWQVHFSGGPFHHAFLALYLAKTSGITFGEVTGDGVTNQQVSETTDATRTFDIPYTVQGALGIGTSQAWLDWHFLDGGSETSFPVDAAEVRVTLPAATDAQLLTVNTSDSDGALQTATPDTRTVVVTGGQLTSNVPMEVEVAFPREQIDASVARPAWQSTDTPPTLPTALGVGQPATAPGSYNPGSYNPGTGDYGSSPVSSFNPLDI
ncbi:MAG TPA: DUF2207 domain-containing protein, partial [Ktedonobacterales bacterium]|nr:DUF2207 domain-containing protein [Ktedonobacterales bacterium]